MKRFILLLAVLLSSAQAKDIDKCSESTAIEQNCRIKIEQLRPTQAGIGVLQVEDEVPGIRDKSEAKREKLALKKVVPVVMALQTDGSARYFMVDRHHFVSALWRAGERNTVVRIIARLPYDQAFWPTMARQHWVWLNDEKGRVLQPADLPARIDGLRDFPYRSLAGLLEDEHYIDKSGQVYFVEFIWAQWLGQQMNWQAITRDNIKDRLKEAERLACKPAAQSLVGYAAKKCQK